MPIICFAFYFENMLIPVSNAYEVNDSNGARGMRASTISLLLSFGFYAALLPLLTSIKHNLNYKNNSQLVYIAIYQEFDTPYACICLVLMAVLAVLQALCFFQLALE
jgi:hypothetical protein